MLRKIILCLLCFLVLGAAKAAAQPRFVLKIQWIDQEEGDRIYSVRYRYGANEIDTSQHMAMNLLRNLATTEGLAVGDVEVAPGEGDDERHVILRARDPVQVRGAMVESIESSHTDGHIGYRVLFNTWPGSREINAVGSTLQNLVCSERNWQDARIVTLKSRKYVSIDGDYRYGRTYVFHYYKVEPPQIPKEARVGMRLQ